MKKMLLSEELESFRCDRPSEWKMDDFIAKAKELEIDIALCHVDYQKLMERYDNVFVELCNLREVVNKKMNSSTEII